MIIGDFEVFVKDWMFYFIDTDKKQGYYIINDVKKLQKFYDTYKNEIMVFYNGKHYDQYILQGILCGFNPKEINDWIINKDRQGWQFSQLLRKFPIILFDTMLANKGLKQCEASLGLKIKESSIPFDIDRKLTDEELKEVLEYCKHDVWSTLEVFLQRGFYGSPQGEFTSSLGILKEFNFPIWYLSKTKSQLGCSVLGASYQNKLKDTSDEFDIVIPDNLILGKYEHIAKWFTNKENHWYTKKIEGRKSDIKNELITDVAGLPHVFAFGGVHASVTREIIDGELILLDFNSLYPNIMVQYDLVSRGVPNSGKYKELLDARFKLKAEGDYREEFYKIALNGSYGQMKFESSPLYDPRNANNVCIYGQLILVDLIDKIESYGSILNSNTDGVLIKLHNPNDKQKVINIANEVAKRVRIGIGVEEYTRFIIKDVNNYIGIRKDGKVVTKGGYVKKKHSLEYTYNIVNHAIREYFVNNTPVSETVSNCNNLMDFQIIANVGRKYKYAMYGDTPLIERVNRVFASTNPNDKGIFKLHRETGTKAKIEMTPECCFIDNGDIRNKPIPSKLDKQFYINLANRRVREFVK